MQFEQTDHISPDLIGLFENTVLGTNGAKYKHLDVAQSVSHTDHPLSFSLRRREQLIANITFCKRPFGLYLRYFAFDKRFQSKGKARMNPKSQIKKEIEVMKMCKHPNIVRLVDLFESSDSFYLVLEFMGGGDLFDYLKARTFRLKEDRARDIIF